MNNLTPEEQTLIDAAAASVGTAISIIPGNAEKKVAYLKLIAEKVNQIAEIGSTTPAKPIKAVSDASTNLLHAIHGVLPKSEDPQIQRQQARFKSGINATEAILNAVGL